jgi:hypothetical protein
MWPFSVKEQAAKKYSLEKTSLMGLLTPVLKIKNVLARLVISSRGQLNRVLEVMVSYPGHTRSQMNVLQPYAPQQLAHAYSAEEGSTGAGEDAARCRRGRRGTSCSTMLHYS